MDDNPNARRMTSRRLRRRGFEVLECADTGEFYNTWIPGTVDVILSDWQLTHQEAENGDRVLAEVRKRDWDVPFVLISGKLEEASQRATVLEHLLDSGGARFVQRGDQGIQEACDVAEDLVERRDQALLRVILALRPEALAGTSLSTTAGEITAVRALEDLVSKPAVSHDAGRPIARARSKRILGTK